MLESVAGYLELMALPVITDIHEKIDSEEKGEIVDII